MVRLLRNAASNISFMSRMLFDGRLSSVVWQALQGEDSDSKGLGQNQLLSVAHFAFLAASCTSFRSISERVSIGLRRARKSSSCVKNSSSTRIVKADVCFFGLTFGMSHCSNGHGVLQVFIHSTLMTY